MRAAATLIIMTASLSPALAQDDLPEGVKQLLTCGHTFMLHSDDQKAKGDEGAATEFYYRGDELLWRARLTLEQAGYDATRIGNVVDTAALTTGFSYGGGAAETLLADCIGFDE